MIENTANLKNTTATASNFKAELPLFKEYISSASSISLLVHISPDGDAIGAAIGLYHYLKDTMSKDVKIVSPNKTPMFLDWLTADIKEDLIVWEDSTTLAKERLNSSTALFYIDFNSFTRVGKEMSLYLESIKKPIYLIDHHLQPEEKYEAMLWDIKACSTSEIIFKMISALNNGVISKKSAIAIYTGIMTDTGNFAYGNIGSDLFRIVASIIDLGVDTNAIYQKIYYSYSADRQRLMGYSLYKKMVVIPELHTAYMFLSRKDMKEFDYADGDSEGFVNLPLFIKGIRFTAFFREGEYDIRMSFRSHGDFSVNDFARKHFNGGGHVNAAGARTTTLNLNQVLDKFKLILEMEKDTLKNI